MDEEHNYTEHSYESYWQFYFELASEGDTQTTRTLFKELIRTLEGVSLDSSAITNSPAIRLFLANKLKAALEAQAKDVSKALGITLPAVPPRGKHNQQLKLQLLKWYYHELKTRGLSINDRLPFREVVSWRNGQQKGSYSVSERTLRRWLKEQSTQEQFEVFEAFKDVPSENDEN